ncbi:S8 family peptidase [Sphingomonas sp. NFX23]|uniref:S8 family peptidase n=1 Tax=Sphingomonas sp. NFX23 TaxID=2819532 RepID=UPI003CFB923B
MASHEHILLRNIGVASKSFKSPDTGRSPQPPPPHDRKAHARRLKGNLSALRADLQAYADSQRRFGVPDANLGRPITLVSRVDTQLAPGKGNVDSKDKSILGVRRRWTDGAGPRVEARMFVTEAGLDRLIGQLEGYAAWRETDPGNRPANFWLFAGAEEFSPSSIEDYWNDLQENLPRASADAEWEVWTRNSMERPFEAAIADAGLEVQGTVTRFVDTNVRNVIGTRRQLMRLIEESAAVVELRGASSFVAHDMDLPPDLRRAQVMELAGRIVAAKSDSPVVTVLDTGVNRANPLLSASLPQNRCHVARSGWDRFDSNGHGTKMAGVALFGDLAVALAGSGPVQPGIGLESVTVSAPGNPAKLPARDALRKAIEIVEVQPRRRVYCLAATAVGEAEDGRPTSTSATLDSLAFNGGDTTRLFVAAVGNVTTSASNPYRVMHYAMNNEDHGIQSPAQALNALSVGAVTSKCSTTNLLAASGGLSPTSRTAQAWQVSHPRKPDIVMEGGNHFIAAGGRTSIPHVPDMVVTTSRDVVNRPITVTGETSAATAAASRLAALTLAEYPEMRAETVRALMVNAARWTPAMIAQRNGFMSAGMTLLRANEQLLKSFGWGVPDEDRLFYSAQNALTLVVEDTIRPYRRKGSSGIRLNEMKTFRLPWPRQALDLLAATPVELRCTLSYFVEPDPNNAARDHIELYPSHRLKFDLSRFGETDDQAEARFNDDLEAQGNDASEAGWDLGFRYRNRGTLHNDVWSGPAYQLRDRNLIMVAPNHGWWSERQASRPEDRIVNFSLVVSLSTPDVTADLYAEVLALVGSGRVTAKVTGR